MQGTMGRLVVHSENCRGCRSCQLACSFARDGEYNPRKACIGLKRNLATEKTEPEIFAACCDLCDGEPACVSACTYGAIEFLRGPEGQGEERVD
jgi:Fe-S-cluster-containing hydrogenase component 2